MHVVFGGVQVLQLYVPLQPLDTDVAQLPMQAVSRGIGVHVEHTPWGVHSLPA
jgi:hypothetical protein